MFASEREALLAASIFPVFPWAQEPPAFPEELLKTWCQPDVGGKWNVSMARPGDLPVGAALRIVVDKAPASRREDPVDLPAKLISIQQRFSLNVTQLSKVLRVERPTVYAWLAEESTPHPTNLERIHTLYRLAAAWNRLRSEPLGQSLREPLDGASLLQLLESPAIASEAVMRRLQSIAESRRQKRPRRSALDVMREHGFAPTPEWMAREAIDSLSHK
jgi:hypothetical protein